MRKLHLAVCVLAVAGTVRADDSADIAALAARFTAAVRAKDKAVMEQVLRPDYVGHGLPGSWPFGDELDRPGAVALWADPIFTFDGLTYKTTGVRLYGGTAIESGTVSVAIRGSKGRGNAGTYNGVRFVRVWLKDEQGWRVAHESY